ncbi:uncharacterized protein AKAME5_002778500, partial [Lates japonicus]
MDSSFRGCLCLILILFTLPHLTCTMECPNSCQCSPEGAVMCGGYTITDIPEQLPVHTYLLLLSRTNMNIINAHSLANRDLLLRFSLTQSHLHTIHPQAFHVAPQLKSVQLSNNDLSTLPARVFSPLTTLEELHLNGNQLETIASEMFDGLVGLLVLDLSRNKLTSPPSNVFDGLINLNFLNLGRNSIKKLPPTIFNSLTKLQRLSIYYNELEVLEAEIFDKLVNLQELKLHQNQIASLPPQVFWSLRNLHTLTLSANRLQAIPEKSFYNMPKLTQLTIYKNPLLSLPDQLMGHMPEMREFYLYDTNLTTVPGNLFANMSGLLTLNFHLNEELRKLPSDLFCCLPNLKKLSLKFNNLHHLHPQLFSRLTTLGMLFLNDNKLQNLPEYIFQGLGRLFTIDLKNNHLKTLPGDVFLSNTALGALNLSGNPWDCTCSIRGIARWIRRNEHVVTDKEDVICHSPMYQMLRTIGSLRDEEFNFCDATRVPSYFHTQNDLHEPTQSFHTISTNRQQSGSTTMPPTTTSTTIMQGATQQVTIPATTKPAISTTSDVTTLSSSLHTVTTAPPKEELPLTPETDWTSNMSPFFYDRLVVEQGPEFVHHSRHRGWVYVWLLPSDTALTGFFMFCHILLVAAGLFFILAAMYVISRCRREKMDLPLTLDVLLLLSSLNAVVWACPDGCHCQETKVICNGLSDFPRAVPSSTTALYFSNCRIDSLKPEDLADFSNALGILLIKDTVLREVRPGTFNSTLNISLYENQLESLGPGVFGPMALKELWLYDNKLSRVEGDTFRNLTQLHLLVLSRNQISYVATGAFRGLEQLGEISLHTNLLTNLQAGTFQGLPSLVNISLEHNFISSLPLGFLQGVSHLGQIDLRNNSLSNLPQESLDALNVAEEVLLQLNPWRCDKDILPLRDWLRQHPSKANQTLVVCEIPPTLNGEVIALLTNENPMPLSSTEEPVLTSTEKRRKPHTPPTRRSTSSPAVKTTATSEHEE